MLMNVFEDDITASDLVMIEYRRECSIEEVLKITVN